ncbi:hypothetical protein [Microcoleus sp. F10-A1]
MRVLLSILILIVLSCTSRQEPDIKYLDLSNHNLSAIPDSVFSLTQLESLELGNSVVFRPPLSGLAYDISSGDSLNKITQIPKDIQNLKQLRTFGICFNALQSLPKELINLKKLDTLDLSFNEQLNIATAFDILQKMSWLKSLNIIGTHVDSTTVDRLRKALPDTKIEATLEDLQIDSVDSTIIKHMQATEHLQ